jgi:hypothetical protein
MLFVILDEKRLNDPLCSMIGESLNGTCRKNAVSDPGSYYSQNSTTGYRKIKAVFPLSNLELYLASRIPNNLLLKKYPFGIHHG